MMKLNSTLNIRWYQRFFVFTNSTIIILISKFYYYFTFPFNEYHLSLFFLKLKVLPFMKFVEDFQIVDMSLSGTLMARQITMKFDDSCIMHDHILKDVKFSSKTKDFRNECGWALPNIVHTQFHSLATAIFCYLKY